MLIVPVRKNILTAYDLCKILVVLTNTCLARTHFWRWFRQKSNSTGTSLLLHCFSAFRDSMLCEFSWKDEFARRLDVASRHGLLLSVFAKASRFRSNLLEGIVHKGIQDCHSFLGDTNLRMDLLQNFVDVDVESFISLASTWLVAGAACWSSSWHDFRMLWWSTWCCFF